MATANSKENHIRVLVEYMSRSAAGREDGQ